MLNFTVLPLENSRSSCKSTFCLQGLGVSRRFVEERIRDRVLKEGKESGTLEVIDGKVEKFLWEGNDVTGKCTLTNPLTARI